MNLFTFGTPGYLTPSPALWVRLLMIFLEAFVSYWETMTQKKSSFYFLPFNLETTMLRSPLRSHSKLQDKTGCDPLEAPSTGHRGRKSDISGRGMSALLWFAKNQKTVLRFWRPILAYLWLNARKINTQKLYLNGFKSQKSAKEQTVSWAGINFLLPKAQERRRGLTLFGTLKTPVDNWQHLKSELISSPCVLILGFGFLWTESKIIMN